MNWNFYRKPSPFYKMTCIMCTNKYLSWKQIFFFIKFNNFFTQILLHKICFFFLIKIWLTTTYKKYRTYLHKINVYRNIIFLWDVSQAKNSSTTGKHHNTWEFFVCQNVCSRNKDYLGTLKLRLNQKNVTLNWLWLDPFILKK